MSVWSKICNYTPLKLESDRDIHSSFLFLFFTYYFLFYSSSFTFSFFDTSTAVTVFFFINLQQHLVQLKWNFLDGSVTNASAVKSNKYVCTVDACVGCIDLYIYDIYNLFHETRNWTLSAQCVHPCELLPFMFFFAFRFDKSYLDVSVESNKLLCT